ncbi:ROK family transcriptional regulator [Micromonospora sp. PPF5-17]|uniref:ROK family transcriptional regulator n=1 Tax=Micromonospora solifontis TaxID=2487138 RepID=A0ABX9WE62_9ACTN|nr:ROK family transcriptional regulator [Micromonospora sp. PPF5-17B]NES38363.1 ROK family transcriptional regulator [Micromonospora solifontis]NES58115.1 ROK family transcriptional regulator [Micromonospora sp. PPF5-6]RNL95893.1 ROK family transcriptional regulator [Micromonospora solifontis]
MLGGAIGRRYRGAVSGPRANKAPHASSKAAVLDAIRAAGTISRVGLIDATGFTAPTISNLVRKLIDEGLVVETGHAESTGGKRRVLLQLNHAARYAVGVHLDHGVVTYVLTDLAGVVVARICRPGARAEEPSTVVSRIAAEIPTLIDSVGVDRARLVGVGLVFPGPLTGRGITGTVDAGAESESRQWRGFPLGAALEQTTALPVVVDNDATAAALGEHWAGGFGTASAAAALYLGSGIGAGLVINGITYRGPSGNAGELGHVCVQADGPRCWCGARGCVEAVAGPATVVAAARADPGLARAIGLSAGGGAAAVARDFAAIGRAARRGEGRALALCEESARYVAAAARTLANVMDLEVIVLTGPGFAVAGSVYLPVVRQELHAVFSRTAHPVDVRLSRSAATASAVGAAALVLESELVPLSRGLRVSESLGGELAPLTGSSG